MLQVQVLDTCWYCQGKAMLATWECHDENGNVFTVYGKCPICKGTGESARWISLADFWKMLKTEQCQHEHTAHRGRMHFSAGDVWDDIEEVCIDCGANLDRQPQPDYIDDPPKSHVS